MIWKGYEIEVAKIGQNYPLFLTVDSIIPWPWSTSCLKSLCLYPI